MDAAPSADEMPFVKDGFRFRPADFVQIFAWGVAEIFRRVQLVAVHVVRIEIRFDVQLVAFGLQHVDEIPSA